MTRRSGFVAAAFLAASPLFATFPQDAPPEPVIPAKYALRFHGRAGLSESGVGNAIHAGLEWLRAHQAVDGYWDADQFMGVDERVGRAMNPGNPSYDVGLTGLALLAFLADGNTPTRGEFAATVEKGIGWLRGQQAENGLLGPINSNEFFYSHLMASQALVEAFGLDADAALRPAAQAAVEYVEHHRNRYLAWHYQPRDGKNDTSVTTWAMCVLITAQDFGLNVDGSALDWGDVYLQMMTRTATGRTGYADKGGQSSRRDGDHALRFPLELNETMTGAALLVELLLGYEPEVRLGMPQQIALVPSRPPRWDPAAGSIDLCGWYYGSMAMRQVGGAAWRTWWKALCEALLPHQCTDGGYTGSWDAIGVWGEDGGRIYATAMAVLALTAPYRYAELALQKPLPDVVLFRGANVSWATRRYDDFAFALDRLEGIEDLDEPSRLAIARARQELDARTRRAEAMMTGVVGMSRDYGLARDCATGIAKQFGRLPPGRTASALVDRYKKDKHVQSEIKAQETYDELVARYDPSLPAQRTRLLDGLYRIVKQYPDTHAAERAQSLVNEIRREP